MLGAPLMSIPLSVHISIPSLFLWFGMLLIVLLFPVSYPLLHLHLRPYSRSPEMEVDKGKKI